MSSTYVDGTTPLDAAHMNALQQKVEKGIANGYPSLDPTGKIPSAQLPPISSVDYAGAYNPATTYHAGEFVVGADGITYQCVKDGTVGISPVPWAPAPSIPYGTSLPASPVDGQEAVLVDSVSNPTYQWRFRYNAGHTGDAYKWEFVGGVSTEATVNTDESLGASTSAWLDAPTVGPSIVVARAGAYEYEAVIVAYNPGGAAGGYIGVAIGAGTPLTAGGLTSGGANLIGNGTILGTITLAAGNEARLRYYQQGPSQRVTARVLRLTPVRVS